MFQFIAMHWKQFITITFIVGSIEIVIRVMDELMPENCKRGFGNWINAIAPKLDRANLYQIYTNTRDNQGFYSSILLLIIGVIAWRRLGLLGLYTLLHQAAVYTTSDFISIGDGAFGAIATAVFTIALIALCNTALDILFDAPTPSESAGSYWLLVLFLVLVYEAFVLVLYGGCLLAFYSRMFHLSQGPSTAKLKEFLTLPPLAFISIAFLIFTPMVMLVFLRTPVFVLSKAALWLARYPKGPWAGLVFVLDIILGIFRLFIK